MLNRITLFVLTNLAVLVLAGIVMSIFQLSPARMSGLLVMAAICGFGGSLISLLLSKWMAKRSTGAVVITNPRNDTERWLLQTVERQARAAELAAHPFNPAKARSESSSDGGPMRENPSFHSQSPLEQRLNDLLNADPDRFKALNQQMSKLDAGQALDSQVRNQANAEDRAREHAQTSTQQATQQEHSASAMGR